MMGRVCFAMGWSVMVNIAMMKTVVVATGRRWRWNGYRGNLKA